MTFVTFGIIAIVVFVIYKVIRFMLRGGTLTQPAINSTHLYFQIRNVYYKMDLACAAYFALRINSTKARNEFPKKLLLSMVRDFKSDADWDSLCHTYTIMWLERVAHKTVPWRLQLGVYDKIAKEIDSAKQYILNGGTRYETILRLGRIGAMEAVSEYTMGVDE